jgi:hypothetical protein
MAQGVLGITEISPFVSAKPDTVQAAQAQQFPHPRQALIQIFPQWDQPLTNAQGQFLRFPLAAIVRVKMGLWAQDRTFTPSPGPERNWQDGDILRPEMLAKHPNLEGYIRGLLAILEQEAAEAGVI